MNNKQKLGYMASGAGMLAIGLIIGQFLAPDIDAQSKSVFDKIYCRQIVVEDAEGKPQMILADNRIDVFNKQGKGVISLIADNRQLQLLISDPVGKKGISLLSIDKGAAQGNIVSVFNKQGKTAIALMSTVLDSSVRVYDKQGKYIEVK